MVEEDAMYLESYDDQAFNGFIHYDKTQDFLPYYNDDLEEIYCDPLVVYFRPVTVRHALEFEKYQVIEWTYNGWKESQNEAQILSNNGLNYDTGNAIAEQDSVDELSFELKIITYCDEKGY